MIHKVTYPQNEHDIRWLEETPVVGVTFQAEGMRAISQPRIKNLRFTLEAEPSNIHDQHAIAVLAVFTTSQDSLSLVQVGYLQKELAKWIRTRDVLDQIRVAGHMLFEDETETILGIRLVLNRKEQQDDS